jgi:maltooligosyltrehalose trehalohydrolase
LYTPSEFPLGAVGRTEGGCSFLVWAPRAKKVDVHILSPRERFVPMQPQELGYFHALVKDVSPGVLYNYTLDGETDRPDPVSRFQPQGVHGPSQVMDNRFDWSDQAWCGLALRDYVLYELHVGAFTPQGTFDAIIPRIPDLKALGVTAIEIMPVAQFPGSRNWGYDGVYPFAVQDSYGGPQALKRVVNACHQQGMGVVLDVVYNHLGPEGNYAGDFGFYFTDLYKTPWGAALNFEQDHSDEVRRYFIENALQWITDFHMDGLRLDAIHAIVDPSARPFIEELGEACHQRASELNREVQIIAESNRNDKRTVLPLDRGGWALDAQWNDDFHHSLRVALTGEQTGYYQDFAGVLDLAKAFRDGFVYSGQYSKFRKRHYGNSSSELPGQSFVVFGQNHDQVGNRKVGDRLSTVVSFEQLKLAAATTLLSPYVPLLFMGEEYGEKAPFQYFVSHSDSTVIEAVRKGRGEEFASFKWPGELPDPQDEGTFLNSKLNWDERGQGQPRKLWDFYRELLRLRSKVPALARLDTGSQEVTTFAEEKIIFIRRWEGNDQVAVALHFGKVPLKIAVPLPEGRWGILLSSADLRWGGPEIATPNEFNSTGKLQIVLNPCSVVLWTLLP